MVDDEQVENVRKGLETALYHVLLQTLQEVPHGVDRDALLAHLRGGDELAHRGEPLPHAGALGFVKKRPLQRALDVLAAQGVLEVETEADDSAFVALTPEAQAGDAGMAPEGFLEMVLGHRDPPLREDEKALFESLRGLRLDLARDQDVPAYVVCTDKTLKQLVRHRPTTREALRAVHGVGPAFMERYADRFLARLATDAAKPEEPGEPEPDTGADTEPGSEPAAEPDTGPGAEPDTEPEPESGSEPAPEQEDASEGPSPEPEAEPSSDAEASTGPSASGSRAPDPEPDVAPPDIPTKPRGREGEWTREDALEALEVVFDHDGFLPGQWEVIQRVLQGESAVAIFPTGGGKSLCYQLPAVLTHGTTLVVSPLKALMKDQVDALRKRGVAAAREDSSTSYEASQRTLEAFAKGELDLLYVAPERFNNDRFVEALADAEIDLLAIDEAHCISEWGHSFRPDYLKLARYAREWGIPQVVGLTATATPRVAEDMCQAFDITMGNVVRLPSHRGNLDLEVRHVPSEGERFDALVEELQRPPQGPTIVYAKRRRTTVDLAERLQAEGFPARPFHAGLQDEEKHATQDWFMSSGEGIVVATIAFGMGVDKPDIRRVLHHNLPTSLESYAQEVGRAGRDGEASRCTLLYHPPDVHLNANYEWGTTPTVKQFEAVLTRLFHPRQDGYGELDFLAYEKELGVPRNKVRTLVALLENEEVLRKHTPVPRKHRYRLLTTEQDARHALSASERDLFDHIQSSADHKRKWSHLNLDDATDKKGVTRQRIGQLLDTLTAQGHVESQARDYVHRYEVLQQPDDLHAQAQRFHDLFQGLEDRAIQRIQAIPQRFQNADCLWQVVSHHFGEEMHEPCGHCSVCRNDGEAPALPLPGKREVPEEAHGHLEAALEKAPELADEPLVLAEFLCGRYSIGVRGHGLHRLDGYRVLEGYGMEGVVGWVRGEVE